MRVPPPSLPVLLVEHNPIVRKSLAAALVSRGCLVESAASVREAISCLRRNPRCLLLGLMLSDGRAIRVLREARRQKMPLVVGILADPGDLEGLKLVAPLNPDQTFLTPIDEKQVVEWVLHQLHKPSRPDRHA